MLIEDYGIIGDTQTVALVSKAGSIDWLCLPRFDSGACFAALLGSEDHGFWKIAPQDECFETTRAYRDGTLILETQFKTSTGCARLIDCMPPRERQPDIVRVVVGVQGRVRMRMKLVIRFDYGSIVPWVRQVDDHLEAVAGPDALSFWAGVETHPENLTTIAEFEVGEGDQVPFVLLWHPSYEPVKKRVDAMREIDETEQWWRDWIGQAKCEGEWSDAMKRSLITLKALTYAPSGGIVAAATTSLPEKIGGVRNWDYRYCWLRDATFTLLAFMNSGFSDEAAAWRDWLLRAVAGDPGMLQIMYGVSGERRLEEYELPWLPGYEGSLPVRVGNAAHTQFQLDVYGELMDAMHEARKIGLPPEPHAWRFQLALLRFLSSEWNQPDEGIWEIRGNRRHFTHSKVMAWVAFDRAVKAVESFGLTGEADRWRSLRDQIHSEVCSLGFSRKKNAFTQEYGTDRLDASLLMLPMVGFLSPQDERIRGTVSAIERELMVDGFVLRYHPDEAEHVDALPPGEGCFLLCTFWLADYYALAGNYAESRRVFDRLLAIRNDLGLLAEEYDPHQRRMLGNFPQAFSHIGVINTARALSASGGPAQERSCRE